MCAGIRTRWRRVMRNWLRARLHCAANMPGRWRALPKRVECWIFQPDRPTGRANVPGVPRACRLNPVDQDWPPGVRSTSSLLQGGAASCRLRPRASLRHESSDGRTPRVRRTGPRLARAVRDKAPARGSRLAAIRGGSTRYIGISFYVTAADTFRDSPLLSRHIVSTDTDSM